MSINVIYLTEAQQYIADLPEKARAKMLYNISLVQAGVKDVRIFKKISDTGIWEFRASNSGNEYRLLSFWDKNNKSLVVSTHGFDKKTQKTPKQEISHAEQIMNDYYEG